MIPAWHEKAQAMHVQGHKRQQIADHFGVTTNMIGKVLRGYKSGDSRPAPMPVQEVTPSPRCPAATAEIRRLHGKGVPFTHIAASLRLPYAEVRRAIGA